MYFRWDTALLRPFVMPDFFLRLQTECFCFQVSFCPGKCGNRACSFRNESDYSRRGTQISFQLLESRRCENFGLTVYPIWSKKKIMARKLKNKLLIVRNSRNCDSREAGNWSGYLSESSQTHCEKSRLDILAFRGKTSLKAKKNSVCNLKKEVSQNKRP